MRKRWRVTRDFKAGLVMIWLFGWAPIFVGIWAIDAPNGLDYKGHDLAALIFLAIWFGIPAVVVGVGGVAMFARFLWRERPRRVFESVEDLREAYRD